MPDIGVSDNATGLMAKIAKATLDAAAAANAAATAQSNAAAAQAKADAAKSDAVAAQSQASATQTALTVMAAAQGKVQRVSVSTPALTLLSSTQDVAVTWPQPFADANYAVIPTVWVTAGTIGKFTAQPKMGTITNAGCTITVASLGIAIAAGQTLDVLAIHP